MAKVIFTENLRRHIDCPSQTAEGNTVAQVLQQVFHRQQQLKHYILDDQNRLRKHMLISVNGKMIQDRIHLTDPVKPDAEIYVIQALSGG